MASIPEDKEDDLLYLLNDIANMAIGNEEPVDVGYDERTTLPEMLAYVMFHPTNLKGVLQADAKLAVLMEKIKNLQNKVYIIKKKIYLKNREYLR